MTMNGCYVYKRLLKNLGSVCRVQECDLSADLRKHFSISCRFDNKLKLFLEKTSWQELRAHCNEKLTILGEILTRQCNFVVCQRARRSSQVWTLYQSLYSEQSLQNAVCRLARNFLRARRKPFSLLLGACVFSWEADKITDDEIQSYRKFDNEVLEGLCDCRNQKSLCVGELDKYRSGKDHPTAPISGQGLVKKLVSEGWEAVIQKECVQVWRKAAKNSYLYEYKIMGTFYDVPARTFFAVQTDIEYRKKWDKLVIKLDVIDKENNEGGCEVMHWVMHYPYPMYSREYVYIRRAVVSPETNTMVLVSRAVEHPSCPVDKKYVRVTDYSSRMVIRPHRTYDENGFDYVLTYFDDPQAAFPAPAYNWMASSGVPDFVEKLHNAARELHCQDRKNKTSLHVPKQSKDSCTTNNNSGNIEYIYM